MIKNYIETVKAHYIDFEGRCSLRDYWTFTLFTLVINLILAGLASLVNSLAFLSGVFGLVVFLPSLGFLIRRLHDTNKSAWWLLLFLTGIGGVIILIFTLLKGDEFPNDYGEPVGDVDNILGK
ncbi:DUF805 domain-containing protein [Myroides sp. LJL119]